MFILLQSFFAFTAVISSLLVITSKNPVISVLFLISVFVNSAIYLMFLGVNFIGISYIIVYVGAIAILFLFILMMINIKLTDILEIGTDYTKNLPLAAFIAAIFIFGVFSLTNYSNILANPLGEEAHIQISSNSFSGPNYWLSLGNENNNIYLLGHVINYIISPFVNLLNTINLLTNTGNLEITNNLIHLAFINTNTINLINQDVDSNLNSFTQVQSLGLDLYTHNASMLILMSLILLLSMLAPILLSNFYKKDKY